MKVLVTGANGFVGSEIVTELSKGSHDLVLLDRVRPLDVRATDSIFVEADISNADEMREVDIGSVNVVIHAAGLAHQFGTVSKEPFWKVNVDGTTNIADLAVRSLARHFILISSVSVYGSASEGVSLRTEKSECKPEGYYAESKLESEMAAIRICEENRLPLTILRLATVIGEGDRGNVFKLIRAIDRRRFLWIGKGDNRKSLVYKNDVARACAAVLVMRLDGTRIYNVSAPPATMKEIVSYMEKALNKNVPGLPVPASLLKVGFKLNSLTLGIKRIEGVSRTIEKWLADDSYSADKIGTEIGFIASESVEQAITREVGWYLKNK